jgi:hypothetical protein
MFFTLIKIKNQLLTTIYQLLNTIWANAPVAYFIPLKHYWKKNPFLCLNQLKSDWVTAWLLSVAEVLFAPALRSNVLARASAAIACAGVEGLVANIFI